MNQDRVLKWIINKPEITDHLIGMIYGIALGECYGNQLEKTPFNKIKDKVIVIDDVIKDIINVSDNPINGIEPYDWGGNMDQFIIIMEIMTENTDFSFKKMTNRLSFWKKRGFSELGDLACTGADYISSRTISKPSFLYDPVTASLSTLKEVGKQIQLNGALVRGLAFVLHPRWQLYSIKQTIMTHSGLFCIYSSWLFLFIYRALLKNIILPCDIIFNNMKDFINLSTHNVKTFYDYKKIYEMSYKDQDEQLLLLRLNEPDKTTYVLKALGCLFYTMNVLRKYLIKYTDKNEVPVYKCMVECISQIAIQGGNTTVNLSIAMSALCAYFGYSKIPVELHTNLKHKDWLNQKIIAYLSAMEKSHIL